MRDVIRDFKKFTSRKIAKALAEEQGLMQKNYLSFFKLAGNFHCMSIDVKVWKDGYLEIELYSSKFFRQKLNYLHQNPVKAGYTDKIEDWPFSSAVDYLGGKSVLSKVYLL